MIVRWPLSSLVTVNVRIVSFCCGVSLPGWELLSCVMVMFRSVSFCCWSSSLSEIVMTSFVASCCEVLELLLPVGIVGSAKSSCCEVVLPLLPVDSACSAGASCCEALALPLFASRVDCVDEVVELGSVFGGLGMASLLITEPLYHGVLGNCILLVSLSRGGSQYLEYFDS